MAQLSLQELTSNDLAELGRIRFRFRFHPVCINLATQALQVN